MLNNVVIDDDAIDEIVMFLNNTLKENIPYWATKLKCKNDEVVKIYSFEKQEQSIITSNGSNKVLVPLENSFLYKKYKLFKNLGLELKEKFLGYVYTETLKLPKENN